MDDTSIYVILYMLVFWYQFLMFIFRNGLLNRHQTILHTFLNFFLNSTLSGVPYL